MGQTIIPAQPYSGEGLFIKLFVSRAVAQAVYLNGLKKIEEEKREVKGYLFL